MPGHPGRAAQDVQFRGRDGHIGSGGHGGIIAATSVETPDPLTLEADRRFFFVIRHQATGAILFVGRVLSP